MKFGTELRTRDHRVSSPGVAAGLRTPAPATRRGFCFASMDRMPKANRLLQAKRFRRHDLHAFGTARLSGRLFRHGNSNGIPEIRAGMLPSGARRHDGAAP